MSEIKITKANFQEEVLNSKQPVLVDFWAPWCGPCQTLGPVVSGLAEELEGKAKIGKVNVDEEQELAAQFRIMSIPSVLVFKNGEVAARSVGVQPKEKLLKMIE